MTTAVATVVTPLEVDELAKEYLALKDKVLEATLAAKAAQAPLDAKAEELKQLIGEFGSAYAEKSKLLHGLSYELMLTYGQWVSIDAAAVERFRLALVKAKCGRLLKRLFERSKSRLPQSGQLIGSHKEAFLRLARQLTLTGAKECEIVPAKIEGLCENTLHNAFPVGSDSIRTDSDPAGRDAC